MAAKYKTPGVYINEQNAFPNSVVEVATAVPAFVGYTPQAEYQGKSYLNTPVKITSWNEFLTFFCFPEKEGIKQQQYSPVFYVEESKIVPNAVGTLSLDQTDYSITPDPSTIYYLYLSVYMFYQNGGGDAYIVSVGGYGKPSGRPLRPGDPLVNPNVSLKELLNGLSLLKKEAEPTMYVFPEATLMTPGNHATLTQEMLRQCEELKTAISILDVPAGRDASQQNFEKEIANFRNGTGNIGLSYGAAYFPFVNTTCLNQEDLDYSNLFGGDVSKLAELINPKDADPTLKKIFDMIVDDQEESMSIRQLNRALLNYSKLYSALLAKVREQANLLPPSGAMAGVMTIVDNSTGVWKAPANVSIAGVTGLSFYVNDTQQGPLNVDSVTGKSVNVLRSFVGQGILVWGARTLDGNSQDYRYISVRRTLIMLEQSCQLAAKAYVFEKNDANTWQSVKSMISNFLTSIWKQGGLAGASPEDAFSVECGLGRTMTTQDILNGIMIITIKVAVTRPAEFIVISFSQQMATLS
ncbi:hypothetical protein SAMN04489724_3542 [Algoriphagus locisalis]|uniref:Tail sheath protein C-terminal domain-containing protein n=1 Tax=Algoriphagus locisalis TaxID=305507 RepID=A0A1I7CX87_9BACT|nr:phage tail sheath C-terminal domain-containing protein [Algoriphagus locisalis]SFU04062.1 hypothetical protein SAMN04489724_3542 [Algoriphagus locisalis]